MKKSYISLGVLGVLLATQLNLAETSKVWAKEETSNNTNLTTDMTASKSAIQKISTSRSVTLPNTSDFKKVGAGGLVKEFKDSTGVMHKVTFKELIKKDNNQFTLTHDFTLNKKATRNHAYQLTIYRLDDGILSEAGICKTPFPTSYQNGRFSCNGNFEELNDQKYIYLRFGLAKSAGDKEPLDVRYYRISNPLYLSLTNAKLRSFTYDTPTAVVDSNVVFTAKAVTGKETLYRFQVLEDGVWNTKQDYSDYGTFNYKMPDEDYHSIRVYTKHIDSKKEYDDTATLMVKGNPTTSEASHISRVGTFSEKNGMLSIQGYSYLKGVQMSTDNSVLRKLKIMDMNTGIQIQNYELTDVKSSSLTLDKNHGNQRINYDWAKFDTETDLSALPIGTYYVELYTKIKPSGSKAHTYDKVITFGSNIEDFSYIKDGKKFSFTRTRVKGISTLGLTVEKAVEDNDSSTARAPYKTNVSQFRVENGRIYISGYAYIEGIELRESKDALKKLKFTDAETNQYIKAYEVPNIKNTYFSTNAGHGNGKLNYDWAKFEGVVDVSDLPTGDYHLKVYANIKNNKRDEIIKFQSGIEDFNFTLNNKLYTFTRTRVKGISTLKLTVSSLKGAKEMELALEEEILTTPPLANEESTPLVEIEIPTPDLPEIDEISTEEIPEIVTPEPVAPLPPQSEPEIEGEEQPDSETTESETTTDEAGKSDENENPVAPEEVLPDVAVE